MTITDVGKRFGVAGWKVRRLFETGKLPPARRLGAWRVFDESDIPAIKEALFLAGYLKPRVEDIADLELVGA